jgi:hypothetical protein
MKSGRYYEQVTLALTPKALEALAWAVRARADEEWEDGRLGQELTEVANEFDARLQHIAAGELQG